MKGHHRVLLGSVVVLLVSFRAVAVAQQSASASSNAALDRMIADGKSHRDVAQYIFDTRGCNECHTIGREGKLGFTNKGRDTSQGFEGCISTLKCDDHYREGTGWSTLGDSASKGPALRAVRLHYLPQSQSGQGRANRNGDKAGEFTFRVRGRGEGVGQYPCLSTLIALFHGSDAVDFNRYFAW